MNTVILVLVFSIGALLAAWAGIRSIQSARSVVFYRTRQAKMLAGWQLLATALVLVFFALGSAFLGRPVMSQILNSAVSSTASPAWTLTFVPTPSQAIPTVPIQTSTQSAPAVETSTSTSPVLPSATPSRTPSYLGTYTALAIWTERRSTFIAMLSFTPTASRTPIPTWTRTPSNTPRPTYTPSVTRTPRPTITHLPTRTPPPTWTASPTRTPSTTLTPSPTRTPTPSRTTAP